MIQRESNSIFVLGLIDRARSSKLALTFYSIAGGIERQLTGNPTLPFFNVCIRAFTPFEFESR